MQNLHALAGARGWPWRIERIERFGRATRATFLHLTRRTGSATHMLVAVRPFEPVSRIPWSEDIRPMPVREALAIVTEAMRGDCPAFTLQSAQQLRGDIHHWQLAPALAFERGESRVLVADAAGMGKTISAGLAIAECLYGATDRRCLVLAPGHLLRQWRHELHHRLSIEPLIVDAAALQRMQHDIPAGVSVWSLAGCLIASIDFLKQPHVLKSLQPAVWDLLVIDEAHLACGVSERRAAAHLVARRSRRVLLLTATPSDGGSDRLRALLSLGAAHDHERIVRLRHDVVARERVERRLWIPPARAAAELHEALGAYTHWIGHGPRIDTPAVALLCSLLVKRALSSAHALEISIRRRLALIGREPQLIQPSLFEPDDDPGVLGAATGLPIERERRWLERLSDMAAEATRDDRRLAALERLIGRARDAVVIFTCFRDTALLVATRLSSRATVQLVHGEMPQAVIDAALDAFTSGRARVLVATDVASQGLNLHPRCRWVLHYDLPWRPPTLRQRFGRVDRLGQTRRPHATFLLDRTAVAKAMLDRMSALTDRMRTEERGGSRRWNVLAAQEARRLCALRESGAGGAAEYTNVNEDVTVLEIEYLDTEGMCIERAVSALRTYPDGAMVWATQKATARGVQLRRRLASRAARRIRRERAVLAAALETSAPTLQQQGLFDRRADRARRDRAGIRSNLARMASEAIARYSLQSRIATVRTRIIATFRRREK